MLQVPEIEAKHGTGCAQPGTAGEVQAVYPPFLRPAWDNEQKRCRWQRGSGPVP